MSDPTGAELIHAERARQIEEEGYTAEHDAEHDGDLVQAAICYSEAALVAEALSCVDLDFEPWPWEPESFKPSDDPVRNLVKAGALIAAEIDRLTRPPT